ncbi:hypothetical protein CDD83_7521 [Cordyceps sp. RAO-2017]|nr:hypothetical protein CDD83_7521 [Cordyceps sp. RAO-2017]
MALLARLSPPRHVRTMASSAAAAAAARQFEFLVVVPDKPGTLAKRLQVRPIHFEAMKPKIESGSWKMGGALLKSVPADEDPSQLEFAGSTLVCVAASRDEVRRQLRDDVYAVEGVWDVEKAQIYPFKCAFRTAMS